MKLLKYLCSIVLLAATVPAEAVDSVVLATGSSASGTIKTANKDEITVQAGARTQTIPTDTIVRVTWDREPIAIKNARGREGAGEYALALQLYKEAESGMGSVSDLGKKDLKYLVARTKARWALSDKSKADEAIAELEAWNTANPDSFRFYQLHEFLGKVYAAKGDVAKAKAAFEQIAGSKYNDLKMKGRNLTADLLLASDDVASALREYSAVAAMPASTPLEKEQKNKGRLGEARCMTREGQPEKAVEVANEVIRDTDKSQPGVHAEAFLRKGDALKAEQKNQQAVMAYLAVDLLFENQPEQHAEALYELSDLWAKVGQSDRASDARVRLEKKYPGSHWLKK